MHIGFEWKFPGKEAFLFAGDVCDFEMNNPVTEMNF